MEQETTSREIESVFSDISTVPGINATPGNIEIIEKWKNAWNEKLETSRPYWKYDSRFPFPYNQDAPAIAYDPSAIPQKSLGPFLQLLYTPPQEANSLIVPREHLASGKEFGTLRHELRSELMPDPENPTLVLVPNRWPRLPYHTLILSREWRAHRLVPEFIQTELEWAARGAVVMFHRRGLILNDFHLHIFAPEITPITQFASSFQALKQHGDLQEGILEDYPVPHIAYSASRLDILYRAISLLNNQLELEQRWFNQVVLRNPEKNTIIVIFVFWPDIWIKFYFDVIGLVRSPNPDLTEQMAVMEVLRAHTNGKELDSIRDTFWRAWATAGIVNTYSIVQKASKQLQQIDGKWCYSPHHTQSKEDLMQIFALYEKAYADKWLKFRTNDQDPTETEKAFAAFRKFYHHAFVLKNAEDQISAFMLAKDTPFGIKFSLGGTNGSSQVKRLFLKSLVLLTEVPGVYAQLSGKMREVVLADCENTLDKRMIGQPAHLAFQFVNPRLAAYLLGINTSMDTDGVHCYWEYFVFPEKKIQRTRVLVVGQPILEQSIVQHVHGGVVFIGDSFLISQRYEVLVTKWERGVITAEDAYQNLIVLIENENLFPSRLDQDKLLISQEVLEPGRLDHILEAWRLRIVKLRILADLYRISNDVVSLASPSTQKTIVVFNELRIFEESLTFLTDLKDDPIAREMVHFSEEAKHALTKYSRVILTEKFKRSHTVIAQGREAIISCLVFTLKNTRRGGIIGIGGASGIGKSTFANFLQDQLEKEAKRVLIIPTDAFLRPRQDFRLLLHAFYEGHFEDALWNMQAYYDFLRKISEFRQSDQTSVIIEISEYYDRVTKERYARRFSLTEETVVIIEGWASVDQSSKNYFDVTITMDMRDDQKILDNLLKRLGADPKPDEYKYLKNRFLSFDRLYAAYLTWIGRHLNYNYILDNTEFDWPILYSV